VGPRLPHWLPFGHVPVHKSHDGRCPLFDYLLLQCLAWNNLCRPLLFLENTFHSFSTYLGFPRILVIRSSYGSTQCTEKLSVNSSAAAPATVLLSSCYLALIGFKVRLCRAVTSHCRSCRHVSVQDQELVTAFIRTMRSTVF
jgi:hypothetical protein